MKPAPLLGMEGDRVVLVPFSEDFVSERYLEWLKDDDTTRWLVKAGPDVGLGEVRAFCRDMIASPNDCFFAIVLRHSGVHVGNVRLGTIDWQAGSARFGIMLGDPAARGIGLGGEIMALIESFAFHTLGLAQLRFPVVEANEAAMKLYAGRGFTVEGPWLGEVFVKNGREWPLVSVVKRTDA